MDEKIPTGSTIILSSNMRKFIISLLVGLYIRYMAPCYEPGPIGVLYTLFPFIACWLAMWYAENYEKRLWSAAYHAGRQPGGRGKWNGRDDTRSES